MLSLSATDLMSQATGADIVRLPAGVKLLYFLPAGTGEDQLQVTQCQYSDLYHHRKLALARRKEAAASGWPWPPAHGATAPEQEHQGFRDLCNSVKRDRKAAREHGHTGATEALGQLEVEVLAESSAAAKR